MRNREVLPAVYEQIKIMGIPENMFVGVCGGVIPMILLSRAMAGHGMFGRFPVWVVLVLAYMAAGLSAGVYLGRKGREGRLQHTLGMMSEPTEYRAWVPTDPIVSHGVEQ